MTLTNRKSGTDGEKLPRVTIVTPSYNQGRYIGETIESVLSQSYPDIEYIVIDGGSTDSTHSVLEDYRDNIDRIISEADAGQSDAINKGLRLATGTLVGWLNADDVLLPNAVERVVRSFQRTPTAVIHYGDVVVVDSRGCDVRMLNPKERLSYDELVEGHATMVQPGSFYPKHAVDCIGLLNPWFHAAMDRDLWLRLLRHGDAVHVGCTVAKFRVHPQSKTSRLHCTYIRELWRLERDHPSSLFSRRKLELARHAIRCLVPLFRVCSIYSLLRNSGKAVSRHVKQRGP